MSGRRYHMDPREFERRLEQQQADRGGPRRVLRRRRRLQRIRTVAILVVGLALLTVAVVLVALLLRP
jgi:tRNA U54 and U55 pseudouridine synthase Pus10